MHVRVLYAGPEGGTGGALLTLRLDGAGAEAGAAAALVEGIAGLDGILGALLGTCAPEVTRTETSEPTSR